MAIEIKQGLKLAQQMVVTPQLQQAIKLLQLSRLELSALVQHELLENPILEEDDDEEATEQLKQSSGEAHEQAKDEDKGHEHATDEIGTKDGLLKEPTNFDWENYLGTYNAADDKPMPRVTETPEDLPTFESTLTKPESLQEHLLWQLHLSNFSENDILIGKEIIGNLNDDGYLQITPEEIAGKTGLGLETVLNVLNRMQEFDPQGIAARDVKECLKIQAKALGADAPLISMIIEEHLHDLETHNYSKIAKEKCLELEKVKEIAHAIANMEPKPGRSYSQENPQYITPDVYVHQLGDEYIVVLNEDGLPKLQVSNFYRRTLAQGDNVAPQTREYIQEKLKAAMWLIRSIHQRQRTLYKVTKSIIKHQTDFLKNGVSHLKPMVLKTVAEDIGMHESTVSRVTTNKFVHTPKGIFELKYFFNAGVESSGGGEGVASEAVKNRIQKLIADENIAEPLSDQAISDTLKQKYNIDVARRTVAKYREMLKIPTAGRRRRRD